MRARSLMAAAAVAIAASVAVPVAAAAVNGGGVCNISQVNHLCMSTNGVVGNLVYGKTPAQNSQENVGYNQALVCGGTSQVDGNGTNCPFASGSGFNTKYRGDNIWYLENPSEGNIEVNCAGCGALGQTKAGNGRLWVAAPVSGTSDEFYLINVLSSQTNGTSEWACTDGIDNPMEISATFLGSGWCTFYGPA